MAELTAKDAERYLGRLDSMLKTDFKPTLALNESKATDKMSDVLQRQRMIIKDLEDLHTACYALLTQQAKIFVENTKFIESLRANILNSNDTIPKELFTEQTEIFNEAIKTLIKRYELNQEQYVNTISI